MVKFLPASPSSSPPPSPLASAGLRGRRRREIGGDRGLQDWRCIRGPEYPAPRAEFLNRQRGPARGQARRLSFCELRPTFSFPAILAIRARLPVRAFSVPC